MTIKKVRFQNQRSNHYREDLKTGKGDFILYCPLQDGGLSRLNFKYPQSYKIPRLFMVIYGYLWLVRVKVGIRVTVCFVERDKIGTLDMAAN